MFGNVTIIFLISLVSEILEQMMKKKDWKEARRT